MVMAIGLHFHLSTHAAVIVSMQSFSVLSPWCQRYLGDKVCDDLVEITIRQAHLCLNTGCVCFELIQSAVCCMCSIIFMFE